LGKASTLLREGAVVPQEAATHFAQQARDKMKRIMEVGASGARRPQSGSKVPIGTFST
jgi:hypothetical protein